MSYFLNTPISYSAHAVCGTPGGPYDGPYTYTWTFSDSTVLTGPTVSKTWTTGTVGGVSVQVYNSSAHNYSNTINKLINLVANPTSFSFHSTGTSLTSNNTIQSFEGAIVLANDILYSFGNYYHGNDVNYFYISSTPNFSAATNLAGVLPTSFRGAFYFPTGPYKNKILLFYSGTGEYGTWDIYTNTYTQISASGGPPATASQSCRSILLNNNKLLVFYYSTSDGLRYMTYDFINNIWSSPTFTGVYGMPVFSMYTLPSGNILVMNNNVVSNPFIYEVATNTIIAGPTYPVGGTGNFSLGTQLSDGSVIYIGESYNVYKFVENTSLTAGGTFTLVSSYPQRDLTSGMYYTNLITMPNNFVLAINTALVSGVVYNENLLRFYDSVNNNWTLGSSTTSLSMSDSIKIFYVYNRFFAVNYGDGGIYYSDIWR